MWYEVIFGYLIVFAVGGVICSMAQVLIIKTALTPARILVTFMIIGMVLQAIGWYEPIFEFARSGISIPIVGFGAALTEGAIKFTEQYGVLGALAGGLTQTAFGVGTAVVASYVVTLIFSSKSKK